MSQDELYLHLGNGVDAFYNDLDYARARSEFTSIGQHPTAKRHLKEIERIEAPLRGIQLAIIMMALGQDSIDDSSKRQKLETVFNSLIQKLAAPTGETTLPLDQAWSDAVERVRGDTYNLGSVSIEAFNGFLEEEKDRLETFQSLLKNKDPEQQASQLMDLAEKFRKKNYGTTAWILAQMAQGTSNTESIRNRAKTLIDHLEDTRSSWKYIVSDILDHGPTSVLTNLVAMVPAFIAVGWLGELGWLVQLLVGGGAHWASSKLIQVLNGYSGQIMPQNLSEVPGELASSTAQVGMGMLFGWGRSEVPKVTSRVWRFAKNSTALGMIHAVQFPFDYLGIKDFAPQGLPSWVAHDTRLAVTQTNEAHRLYKYYTQALQNKKSSFGVKSHNDTCGVGLNILMANLDPLPDKQKRLMVKGALCATAEKTPDTWPATSRWVSKKKELWKKSEPSAQGELDSANNALRQTGTPLRLNGKGEFCFTTGSQYSPCKPPLD
ncbi:MAG TPA: hypothetical protein DF383_05805 [Deltaproteobacteria bacterium]|nr:hypothetical protein [Deltaproteobacteria bacterium]